MFVRELRTSVDRLRGVGPTLAHTLAAMGITDIGSLLSYYPRDWEDRSVLVPLSHFSKHGKVCTEVQVLAHDWFGFGRMKTLKVHVEDETARAVLVCFNRPFLEKQLHIGERYRLYGHFFYKYGEIQSSSFEFEPINGSGTKAQHNTIHGKSSFGSILPIYPLSSGITQTQLRKIMRAALGEYAGPVEDEIPQTIQKQEHLLSRADALQAIHYPSSMQELEEAKRTLIYEELFYLELMVGKRALERRSDNRRKKNSDETQSEKKPGNERGAFPLSPLQRQLVERLPFSLTNGQQMAVQQINADMEGPYPMARLLQGDVGSGKTLVSFMAALRAIELGGQTAILAPTELLARQHAENAARLLEPLGIRPAFLTGNIKASSRAPLLKALKKGDIDLVVGTHALFSKGVVYKHLSLVIVDEQHRFGVVQRSAIMAKGDHPDLLMMSATPIPRTLALTVFGDLDVSIIPDLPPGRLPVITHLAKQANEQKVYQFVAKELAAGRQAYFVYPLIEGGGDNTEANTLKDAQSMAKRLSESIFPQYRIALIHSKLDEDTKRASMEAFRSGQIDLLVATSVVEVGVDVPNANCMVIEHAERFGLSALHQLRGRVGRGQEQAYCFLVYSDSLTEDGKNRMKVMLENHDGFIIAEEDLKLRGPGQIAGIEQSGYLALGIADPVRDAAVLEKTRKTAFDLLETDPGFLFPENRVVAEVLHRAPPFSSMHF